MMPLLRAADLQVRFDVRGRRHAPVRAVDGVSFDLAAGETLGIVGESGCGKSTLARALVGLVRPSAGRLELRGEDLLQARRRSRRQRRDLQLVFQDPLAALDPRMTAGRIVAEPLRSFEPQLTRAERHSRVAAMLARVGLERRHLNRYPHEFSGGQCQRIGIARALIAAPAVLVCDEPVSALDVSIRAQIVELLQTLQQELDLALLFIAHDLAVVRQISHRVLVMYLGRAMELAPSDALYRRPRHPYTRALLAAVPVPDPVRARTGRPVLEGEPPSPSAPPSGCVFRTRCPYAIARCAAEIPPLRPFAGGEVACHRAEEIAAGAAPARLDAQRSDVL